MNPIIYTYAERNGSSRKLAETLNCPRIFRDSDYQYKKGDLIINWGSGHIPNWWSSAAERNCLNHPHSIDLSVDKRRMLVALMRGGAAIPFFTTSMDEARAISTEGHRVYCRTEVEGHDGSGIVIARKPSEIVPAKLYTQYVQTDREFRVHIFKGRVIFVTEKKQQANESGHGDQVRAGSDWFMAWCDAAPKVVEAAAVVAQQALGLDFAGVDVGYNSKRGTAVVFETNTAPGSFGRVTLDRYVSAIRSIL